MIDSFNENRYILSAIALSLYSYCDKIVCPKFVQPFFWIEPVISVVSNYSVNIN